MIDMMFIATKIENAIVFFSSFIDFDIRQTTYFKLLASYFACSLKYNCQTFYEKNSYIAINPLMMIICFCCSTLHKPESDIIALPFCFRSELHCLFVNTTSWEIFCFECNKVIYVDSHKKLYEAVEFIKKTNTKPNKTTTKARTL